jgi:hypothetical protein
MEATSISRNMTQEGAQGPSLPATAKTRQHAPRIVSRASPGAAAATHHSKAIGLSGGAE